MKIYRAQEDKRSGIQQIEEGWFVGYHPKTQMFYTFDPENKQDTFGSRSFTRQ